MHWHGNSSYIFMCNDCFYEDGEVRGEPTVSMFVMGKVVRKLNELFPVAAPQTAGAPKTAASNDDENIAVAILTAMLKGRK